MSKDKLNINVSGGVAEFGNIIQGNKNTISSITKKKHNKPVHSKNVFISYRRSDSADISGRIYDHLTNSLGEANIFKDVYSIPLGVNFKEYITKEISKADVLIAIMGQSWLGQDKSGSRIMDKLDFVRLEMISAFESNIPVIPVFVSNSKMPSEKELPKELKQLIYINGIKVRIDPDFENDINKLIKSIQQL